MKNIIKYILPSLFACGISASELTRTNNITTLNDTLEERTVTLENIKSPNYFDKKNIKQVTYFDKTLFLTLSTYTGYYILTVSSPLSLIVQAVVTVSLVAYRHADYRPFVWVLNFYKKYSVIDFFKGSQLVLTGTNAVNVGLKRFCTCLKMIPLLGYLLDGGERGITWTMSKLPQNTFKGICWLLFAIYSLALMYKYYVGKEEISYFDAGKRLFLDAGDEEVSLDDFIKYTLICVFTLMFIFSLTGHAFDKFKHFTD